MAPRWAARSAARPKQSLCPFAAARSRLLFAARFETGCARSARPTFEPIGNSDRDAVGCLPLMPLLAPSLLEAMKRITFFLLLIVGLVPCSLAQTQPKQSEVIERRVSSLESKIAALQREVGDVPTIALFLTGAFCALWAQNTRRSGWLWFFLGLFFSIFAVLFLLAKNSGDIDRRKIN